MPRVRYTLEQRVYMYDTYVKSGSAREVRRRFRRKFQEITVPQRETVHKLVNKVRRTGSVLDRKAEWKRRLLTEENWMKSAHILNIPLGNLLDALHKRWGFLHLQHGLPSDCSNMLRFRQW